MEFKEIQERCGHYEVWGKWDDQKIYDVMVKIPFNDLINRDKERAKFLAEEVSELIQLQGIDSDFWVTQNRYKIKNICNPGSGYEIIDTQNSNEQIAKVNSYSRALEYVLFLNRKEHNKLEGV